METLHEKKMADLVAVSLYITFLTFELSSFRENSFLVLQLLIPLVGRLKAREGRIQKTDTQTHRQTHRTTTVPLNVHACRELIKVWQVLAQTRLLEPLGQWCACTI